ncbi:MAG: hypothetical protein V3S21_02610 [Xanthomonadales bacterium]
MTLQLRILTGAVFFILSIGAFAQSDTNPQSLEFFEIPSESADINEFDDEDLIEEVIVTSTQITRRDFNTPSPLPTNDSIASRLSAAIGTCKSAVRLLV